MWLSGKEPDYICENSGLIPRPAQWVRDQAFAMSCSVGCRHGFGVAMAVATI